MKNMLYVIERIDSAHLNVENAKGILIRNTRQRM